VDTRHALVSELSDVPLKMRPTGPQLRLYKDTKTPVDYGVFCGEWCIGRIYENRSGAAVSNTLISSGRNSLTVSRSIMPSIARLSRGRTVSGRLPHAIFVAQGLRQRSLKASHFACCLVDGRLP
jgi:hypothetical protein